jgi:hypothetical protein
MKLTKSRTAGPPKQTKGRVALSPEPPKEAAVPGPQRPVALSPEPPPAAPVAETKPTISFQHTPVETGVSNDEGNRDGTTVRGESH